MDTECDARRTVYSKISRGRPHPIFQPYDYHDATQHTPQRQVTTTPLQQLFVLNSQWMWYQAKSLALVVHDIKDPEAKIRALYRRTLARNPTSTEIDHAQTLLKSRRDELSHTPWAEYAQILLGTNEFIYLN